MKNIVDLFIFAASLHNLLISTDVPEQWLPAINEYVRMNENVNIHCSKTFIPLGFVDEEEGDGGLDEVYRHMMKIFTTYLFYLVSV